MRLILLSLVCFSAFPAAFTTVRSGNWTDTATSTSPWCNSSGTCTTALVGSGPGGVPGFGDTITLGGTANHIVTCPTGTTCSAGTDTAGATAILRTGNSFTCGSITVQDGATLQIKGNYASNCFSTNAGTTPLMRLEGAATFRISGTTAGYVVAPITNGGAHPFDYFAIANTTTAKRARIEYTGAFTGRIASSGLGVSCTGCMGIQDGSGGSARYVDIAGLGAASTSGADTANAAWNFQAAGSGFIFDIADYTVTNCGGFVADVIANTAAQIRFRRGVHLWGKSTYDADIAFPSSNTGSGQGLIEDVWMLNALRLNGNYATMNRVLVGNFASGVTNKWAAFNNSIIRKTSSADLIINGPIFNVMFALDNSSENQHNAFMNITGYGTGQKIDGLFIDSLTKQNNGGANPDIGDGWLSVDTSVSTPFYVLRMITGLAADGKAQNNAFTMYSNNGNYKLYTANNTGVQGDTDSAGAAPTFFSVQENGNAPGNTTGQVTGFLNTLLDWGSSTRNERAKARITTSRTPTASDIFTIAGTDYNAAYNCANDTTTGTWTNAGKCYVLPWSSAPGASGGAGQHDIDVLYPTWSGPRFIDKTRSIAHFDREFLGNTSTSAWALATTYEVGSIVSYSNAGWWNGKTVNLVCIRYAGCPGNTSASEPFVGSSWRTYWSFASLYRLVADIQAGVPTYTNRFGTGLTLIEVMLKWFQEGYIPQNPMLWSKGCLDTNYDGVCEGSTYIGAVDPAPLKRRAGSAAGIL